MNSRLIRLLVALIVALGFLVTLHISLAVIIAAQSTYVPDRAVVLSREKLIREGGVPRNDPIRSLSQTPTLQMLIPLYIGPFSDTEDFLWERVITAADTISITAVINPSSGPGTTFDESYSIGIKRLDEADVTVLGYVDTDYSSRTITTVLKEIDSYYRFYITAGLDGIFFDRVPSSADMITYYVRLSDTVRSMPNLGKVVLNPGTRIDQEYIGQNVCDIAVIYEGYSCYWQYYSPDGYVGDYPSDRFGMLVHSVCPISAADIMRSHISQALTYNIGYVYVTNDSMPNPWDTFPVFWEEEVSFTLSPYPITIVNKCCYYLPIIWKN